MEITIFDFYPSVLEQAIGIVSAPHSGETIPDEFLPYLSGDSVAYGRDVDFKTRELLEIDRLNKAGIHVLIANVHRVCIDLNRDRNIALFAWERNSHGEKIVNTRPEDEIGEGLRKKYYDPYYKKLTEEIHSLSQSLPTPVPIIDFHSMPSHPTAYHLKVTPNQPKLRPSFCISNLKGLSCPEDFLESFQEKLSQKYDDIRMNFPYYGGHLTQYIHSLPNTWNFQVETRRNLYMDEKKRELIPSYKRVKEDVSQAIIELFSKPSKD